MAALGSIGNTLRLGVASTLPLANSDAVGSMLPPPTISLTVPAYRAVGSEALLRDRSGAISGTVYDNAAPVPYARVSLYWRPSGVLISSKLADINGAFSFTELDKSTNRYFLVATLSPSNAIVFDLLTPV